MKIKLFVIVVVLSLSANGFAAAYTNSVAWTAADGYWMDRDSENNSINWTDVGTVPWEIPGWVVGNPLNTGGSTSPDWNGGWAHINSGICRLTPASKPDGTVANLYVGSAAPSATLHISTDLTVRVATYMGYESVAGTVSTINHTAGTVVYGTTGTLSTRRLMIGRGAGTSIYNLSQNTSTPTVMTTSADYDSVGYSDTAHGILNMSGGTINDTGTAFQVGAGTSTGTVNQTGGTLNAYGTNGIYIGTNNGGTGTYNLSGDGVLNSHNIKVSYLAGSTGLFKISGGSLNCDRIWYTLNNGKSVVSGSGANSIVAKQYGGSTTICKVLGIELDGNGSTLIQITGRSTETYHGAFLAGSTLEVKAIAGFDGVEGDIYNILWSAAELTTNDLIFSNLTGVKMNWRVVNMAYDNVDGQMLQLIVVPEPATMILLVSGGLLCVRRR